MNDGFRSLKQLTAHVDEKVRLYSQLQAAIVESSKLLDQVPDLHRQIKDKELQLESLTLKVTDIEQAHRALLDNTKLERQELAELLRHEQQERGRLRDHFKGEQEDWRVSIQQLRSEAASIQRQIDTKRMELHTLEQQLASTVKAVLGR